MKTKHYYFSDTYISITFSDLLLCTFLVERGYGKHFVQEQVERARNIPRHEILKDKEKKENKRIPFTVTYHPGLPILEVS